MCFAPKIKTPQVDTKAIPEPAPLTEQPTGVVFGGGSQSDKVDTREDTRVAKTPGVKKSISNKAFN